MLHFILSILLLDFILHLSIKFSGQSWRNPSNVAMALFTPGAIVSEISGKIAATVFSRNRGGAIIRNRRTPINRRSVLQTVRRQALGNLASGWRGLTQAQRDSWNSATSNFPYQNALGQTKFLSGEQLYVQFNSNLNLLGLTLITTAPPSFAFATFVISMTATDAPTLSVVFTPTPMTANNYLAVYATANLSPGIEAPAKSKFRFIGQIDPAATSPHDALSDYQGVFGDPVVGQKIFLEVRPIGNTGQGGTSLRTSAIVTV